MLCSHFIMVIACVLFGTKLESGVRNPTNLTACSKNNQPCTFFRWFPAKKKVSACKVLMQIIKYTQHHQVFHPLLCPFSPNHNLFHHDHWPRFHQGKPPIHFHCDFSSSYVDNYVSVKLFPAARSLLSTFPYLNIKDGYEVSNRQHNYQSQTWTPSPS